MLAQRRSLAAVLFTLAAVGCAAETGGGGFDDGSTDDRSTNTPLYDVFVDQAHAWQSFDTLSGNDLYVEVALESVCSASGMLGRTTVASNVSETVTFDEEVLSQVSPSQFDLTRVHVFVWDDDVGELGDVRDLIAACEVSLRPGLNQFNCGSLESGNDNLAWVSLSVETADGSRVTPAQPDPQWWEVVWDYFTGEVEWVATGTCG